MSHGRLLINYYYYHLETPHCVTGFFYLVDQSSENVSTIGHLEDSSMR